MTRQFLTLATLMVLTGCTGVLGLMGVVTKAYAGKERPVEEVAVLLSAGSGTAYAMLNKLDGKDYGNEVLGYPSEVHALPGEHEFRLRCNDGLTRYAYADVKATLQAGHYYHFLCHDRSNVAVGEIKDLGTADPRKQQ